MALKERGRLARIIASGGGTLVAPSYESYRITDVFCLPSTNDSLLGFNVAGVTVAQWRVKGLGGNTLPYPAVKTAQLYEAQLGTLFAECLRRGMNVTIPVAAGQTLTVTRYAEAGDVVLVYDAYDAGDVKDTDPNGSAATERCYVHPISNAAALTSSPVTLATSGLPTGWDPWPVGGAEVAHGETFDLFGIVGCPAARGNASANKGYTTGVALVRRDGSYLFSSSQTPLPFIGSVAQTADAALYSPVNSLIGPHTAEVVYPALWLPEPVAFKPGDTLTPQIVLTGAASGGLAAGEIALGLLLRRKVSA